MQLSGLPEDEPLDPSLPLPPSHLPTLRKGQLFLKTLASFFILLSASDPTASLGPIDSTSHDHPAVSTQSPQAFLLSSLLSPVGCCGGSQAMSPTGVQPVGGGEGRAGTRVGHSWMSVAVAFYSLLLLPENISAGPPKSRIPASPSPLRTGVVVAPPSCLPPQLLTYPPLCCRWIQGALTFARSQPSECFTLPYQR